MMTQITYCLNAFNYSDMIFILSYSLYKHKAMQSETAYSHSYEREHVENCNDLNDIIIMHKCASQKADFLKGKKRCCVWTQHLAMRLVRGKGEKVNSIECERPVSKLIMCFLRKNRFVNILVGSILQ